MAYFDAANISEEWDGFELDLQPAYSSSLGMVVRYGLSKTFSVETGINYIQRNFSLDIENTELNLKDATSFGMRSYEVPYQLLSYVRVADKWYMNVAFGASHNIFASDVYSSGDEDPFYYQNTERRRRIQMALLANIGLEYRSDKDGYYYFGASLHRPWKEIGRLSPEYDGVWENHDHYLLLPGNFVTLDFRYFFGE